MSKSEDPLSSATNEQETSYVQDPSHCVTKARNRNLKPSSILPMGLKQVSASHLKTLIWTTTKDDHGLVMSDICPLDRQNIESFEKVADKRVLDCLQKFVIDSEATVMYLKVFKEVNSAFMEEDLAPLDRVYRLWHGLYFLRAWRKWIQDSKIYSLKDNFISYNLFHSIEINAYGMLHLITKFRNANQPDLFLPTLFSSQTCESTFRQMRSMTTINWTRINFSLQELLHIVHRIELMNDIIYYRLAEHNVTFPRLQRKNLNQQIYTLPSNEDIQKVLDQARTAALLDAVKIGMPSNMRDIKICPIPKTSLLMAQIINDELDYDEENEFNEKNPSCNSLKDYSSPQTQESLDANSKFVQVYNEDGSSKIVLKSSIIWILTESKDKLSQDRLRRVQGVDRSSMAQKRNNCDQIASHTKKLRLQDLYVSKVIEIGEWCFFRHKEKTTSNKKNPFDKIIFGSALSFKYNEGKTEKEKQYTRDFVPVTFESTKLQPTKPRGISISAKWYKCDSELKLQPMDECNFFVDIENYIATAATPEIVSIDSKSYRVAGNIIELKEKLLELIN